VLGFPAFSASLYLSAC